MESLREQEADLKASYSFYLVVAIHLEYKYFDSILREGSERV
jgi:hypothetical protein